MNYVFETVNDKKPIKNPTFEVTGVTVTLTDENGKQFGVELKVEDLDIDKKVLSVLNKQFGI